MTDDEYTKILNLAFAMTRKHNEYVVGKVNEYLTLAGSELERHLERVAERYIQTVRVEVAKVVKQAHEEALRKYPVPSQCSTATPVA